jgi:hypothetical protein
MLPRIDQGALVNPNGLRWFYRGQAGLLEITGAMMAPHVLEAGHNPVVVVDHCDTGSPAT